MVKLLTVYCALENAVKLVSLNALEKCSQRGPVQTAQSMTLILSCSDWCTSERKKNTPGLLKVCEKEPALAGLPLLRAGTPFCKVRLAFTFCSSQAGREVCIQTIRHAFCSLYHTGSEECTQTPLPASCTLCIQCKCYRGGKCA